MTALVLHIDTTEAIANINEVQAKAELLLATLEKCRDCAKECAPNLEFKLQGKDLIAAVRQDDYRALRTT